MQSRLSASQSIGSESAKQLFESPVKSVFEVNRQCPRAKAAMQLQLIDTGLRVICS
jgi:hypothetical protein